MGSIRSTSSGNLFFDFRYRGIRCREVTRLPDNSANRKRLQQILARLEAEITLGSFDYRQYFPDSPLADQFAPRDDSGSLPTSQAPTFGEFAWEWFAEKKAAWKRSYAKTIEGTLRSHLMPAFADVRIDQISKAHILKFRAQIAAGRTAKTATQLSPDRVNHIMTPMRMIITKSAERFHFVNPWQNIQPLSVRRTHVEPFTLEEVEYLSKNVREDFRNYYTVRFFSGLRTGEIDGLKWK